MGKAVLIVVFGLVLAAPAVASPRRVPLTTAWQVAEVAADYEPGQQPQLANMRSGGVGACERGLTRRGGGAGCLVNWCWDAGATATCMVDTVEVWRDRHGRLLYRDHYRTGSVDRLLGWQIGK